MNAIVYRNFFKKVRLGGWGKILKSILFRQICGNSCSQNSHKNAAMMVCIFIFRSIYILQFILEFCSIMKGEGGCEGAGGQKTYNVKIPNNKYKTINTSMINHFRTKIFSQEL